MRTIKIISILTFLFLFFPFKSNAQISFGNYSGYYKYCVVPPYVKRDVKPNIMIIMDNSKNMGAPAYYDKSNGYNKNKIYSGYFDPYKRYYFSNSGFFEDQTNGISGNILNWALTSRYDLLQLILIGGKSASRQTNVHTMISITGTWTAKLYGKDLSGNLYECIFDVKEPGNLDIKDGLTKKCGYLENPPIPFDVYSGLILFTPTTSFIKNQRFFFIF